MICPDCDKGRTALGWPCETCNGSGFAHCCDGIIEQSDQTQFTNGGPDNAPQGETK